jgi:hypothetical protein
MKRAEEPVSRDIPGGGASAPGGADADLRLGDLLRAHSVAPDLRNPDFFNRSILDRISTAQARPAADAGSGGMFRWPRFAWAGAGLAAAALILAMFARLEDAAAPPEGGVFASRILSARPGEEGISVAAFQSRDQRIAVLWLEGLAYIPEREPDRHVN